MDDNKTNRSLEETMAAIPESVKQEKIPKKIGRYEIISELGRGGMGVVFQAKDTKLNRIVALKVLIGNILTQERKARFFAEAQSMAKLNHENIIKLYDYGDDNGICFFTMDYIKGQTLDKLLKQKPISPKKTAILIEKICHAMSYCHSQKIIHRDLKPSNIMIKEGKPYVMDFGIAKQETDDEGGLTKSGSIIGSPHYMSPEQAEGDRRNIDYRTDIYSLGMILYHCMVGKPCFVDNSVMKIFMKIMHEAPTPPRQIKPRLPENLEKICLKTLEKNKENRYQSMDEFAHDLQKFMRGEDISVRLSKPISPAKKWSIVGVAALMIAIIALTFGGNSQMEELRNSATSYLEQGFSQKAVEAAEQILHKKIADEEAWQIWFSGNYQLLTKNSYADVQTNLKQMVDNIPLLFEVETTALKSALQTQKLIEERLLRKAQGELIKLQNQNRVLLGQPLQKTIDQLQDKIKTTKLVVAKEKLEREEQEKQEQQQQKLELEQKQKQQQLEEQLAKQAEVAEQLKKELEKKEEEAQRLAAQQQRTAEELERQRREQGKDWRDDFAKRPREDRRPEERRPRIDKRPQERGPREGRRPREERPKEERRPEDQRPNQKITKTQMFRRNINRDGHTFEPDVIAPIVKKKFSYGRIPLTTAPVIVGNDLYIHNQVAVYKIAMHNFKVKQTFLKPKKDFTPFPQTITPSPKYRPQEERSDLLWHKNILYFACNPPLKRRKTPSLFCAIETRQDKDIFVDSIKIPEKIITSPLVFNDQIYVGCKDGYVYVLELRDRKFEIVTKYGTSKRKPVISAPVILNDHLIVKYDALYMFSYSLKNKRSTPYRSKIGYSSFTTPVVYDNLLFVANSSGYVSCMDEKLELHWSYNEEPANPIDASLGVSADHVYIFYRDGQFQVFNRLQHEPIGFGYIGPTRCSPVLTHGYMYMGNNATNEEGSILHVFKLDDLIDEEDEILVYNESRPLEGDIVAEPLLYNGKIFVVTTVGNLYVMEDR